MLHPLSFPLDRRRILAVQQHALGSLRMNFLRKRPDRRRQGDHVDVSNGDGMSILLMSASMHDVMALHEGVVK